MSEGEQRSAAVLVAQHNSGPPHGPRWLSATLGGLGVGGTILLVSERRWFEASATAVVSLLAFLARPLVSFIGRFSASLQHRMLLGANVLADSAADRIARWVELRWALFSSSRRAYCRHLEYRFRTFRTQGLKTRGAFAPDLEKVYVPLRVSPNSPNKISPDIVSQQLTRDDSPCLVMLDGLDEVADAGERKQVSSWVERQMQRYPQARFILTSRPYGWLTAPLEVGTVLEIEPFSLQDAHKFVASWYPREPAHA